MIGRGNIQSLMRTTNKDPHRKKYVNNSQLIGALQSRLEGAKVGHHRTLEERRVLEYTIILEKQLQRLVVQLDASLNMQKLLSKSAPRTQRKLLEK